MTRVFRYPHPIISNWIIQVVAKDKHDAKIKIQAIIDARIERLEKEIKEVKAYSEEELMTKRYWMYFFKGHTMPKIFRHSIWKKRFDYHVKAYHRWLQKTIHVRFD